MKLKRKRYDVKGNFRIEMVSTMYGVEEAYV